MKASAVSTTKTYRRDGVVIRRIEDERGVNYELEIDGLATPGYGGPQWQMQNQAGYATTSQKHVIRTPTQLQAIADVIASALEGS